MANSFKSAAEELQFRKYLVSGDWESTDDCLDEILLERFRQNEKWGEQNHEDGTGHLNWKVIADVRKSMNDSLVKTNSLTWIDILLEEMFEAFAESDENLLLEELNQVAAVAVAWRECIIRRQQARDDTTRA